MQKDEQQAMDYLKTFNSVLEEQVPAFEGRIVQFYGDACLLTFDSSSKAVQCAMAIQSRFVANSVPVRMGIHLGEVVFTKDNVFGDESWGICAVHNMKAMAIPAMSRRSS